MSNTSTTGTPLDAILDDLAIVQAIGNTPLLRLKRVERDYGIAPDVELWVKAEWANPGGSVKDRPALAIIRDALRSGELGNGKTLLDGTSGNMGIAYALLGAALGIPVELVLPYSASPERLDLLRAYGATFTLSNPDDGVTGGQLIVERLLEEHPDRYYYAGQGANAANPRAHYEGTGPEIWAQTSGRITHFVAGLGTTGTIMGAGRFFKERNPEIELIAVQPDTYPHGVAGLKHLPTGPVPEIYDETRVDRHVAIDTDDAIATTRKLLALEGLFVGVSTGAALAAAIRVARDATQPAVIVFVAPDNGSKYLSTDVWRQPDPSAITE